MGGDFFTRAFGTIAKLFRRKSRDTKAEENDSSTAMSVLRSFARWWMGWAAELKRQLSEWFQQNAVVASGAASFDLIASGGGFDQPGLLEYFEEQVSVFRSRAGREQTVRTGQCSKGFEVAFGTALAGARL